MPNNFANIPKNDIFALQSSPKISAEHYLFKLIDSNSMLESLQALDRTVFLALNGMHTPYLDSFMYIFTSKLVWIPLYASILYVLYKNMNIRMVIFTTLMFALLIALADQTCSSLLRPIFERPRPSRNGILPVRLVQKHEYPHGHFHDFDVRLAYSIGRPNM